MAQDGTITAVQRGKFLLGKSVQDYIEFAVKGKSKDIENLEREKLEAEASIKKAKAIIEDLNAQELQGKMHRSEDVADMTADLIYSIRGMLMALPGRLAVDIVGMASPAEAETAIREEVYAVMKELSQYKYDAQNYKARVRERRKWEHEDIDDGG